MNEQQRGFIEVKVRQFLEGLISESNKLEFKEKWYRLRKKGKDYYELLKDITAIVNSFGGEYGYIVIGVGQNPRKLYNSNIRDSGKEDNEIVQFLRSGIDPPVITAIENIQIDNFNISVIIIPPSTHKPHMVLEYKTFKDGEPNEEPEVKNLYNNQVYVRDGSSTRLAFKHDLDLMYWERGNIILNEKLIVSMNFGNETNDCQIMAEKILWNVNFTFENHGVRPIPIFSLLIVLQIEPLNIETGKFNLYFDSGLSGHETPIVSKVNKVVTKTIQIVSRNDHRISHIFRNANFSFKMLDFFAYGRDGRRIECEFYKI